MPQHCGKGNKGENTSGDRENPGRGGFTFRQDSEKEQLTFTLVTVAKTSEK